MINKIGLIGMLIISILSGFTNVKDTIPTRSPRILPGVIYKSNQVVKCILGDTNSHVIRLTPINGDNYNQIYSTAMYCNANPGWIMELEAGNYPITQSLVFASLVNGFYQQFHIVMRGAVPTKNTPSQYTSNIIDLSTNGFGLGIQQGKGCHINNIAFYGQYTFPNSLNLVSLDTLSSGAWNVGVESSPTSPYAGIVIDPFSDPSSYTNGRLMYKGLESYYIKGMNQSGSTDITIDGCSFYNYLVGVMVTPSNQQNAELINVWNSGFEKCKVAYACTQAQSKTNTFNNNKIWSFVRTGLDGANYGTGHSDGSCMPFVDNLNIAGGVYDIIEAASSNFSINMQNVFAENLFKIGLSGGPAGCHYSNWQIDFQTGPNLPEPDYHSGGYNITWDNCTFRHYGEPDHRITMNSPDNIFNGGNFNVPPVCYSNPADNSLYTPNSNPATFNHVKMTYTTKWLNNNNYDSVVYIGNNITAHIDRNTFTGYIVGQYPGITVGDKLMTMKWYEGTTTTTFEYPLGQVTSISADQDTTYFCKVGVGIHDGDVLYVYDGKIKQAYSTKK